MSQLYAASSQKTDLLLPNNNIAHAPEHAAILPGLSAPRHSLDHKGENTPCAGASIEAKNLVQEGIRGRAKPSDSSLQLPVLDEAQVLSLNRDGFLRFPFRASFLGAPVRCASLPLVLAKQHQGAQTTKPRGGTQPTKPNFLGGGERVAELRSVWGETCSKLQVKLSSPFTSRAGSRRASLGGPFGQKKRASELVSSYQSLLAASDLHQ